MGVRFPSVNSTTILGSVPAAGTETVIVSTPPLNLPLDFSQVLLFWSCIMLVGASSTGLIYRLRRGLTIGGTQISGVNPSSTVVAGNTLFLSGCFADVPGAVAGQQWSLTVQGIATTGAWNTTEASFTALVL